MKSKKIELMVEEFLNSKLMQGLADVDGITEEEIEASKEYLRELASKMTSFAEFFEKNLDPKKEK